MEKFKQGNSNNLPIFECSMMQKHPLPEWLNKDYLENALRTYHEDNGIRIKNMYSRPAVSDSENYGSILTRLKAEYRTGAGRALTGHYIAKTMRESNGISSEYKKQLNIFKREMDIYHKVIPKLKALMKETGDSEQLFAEAISVDYDRKALIFENLAMEYFEPVNRNKGFDIVAAKMAIRKLAKMHAISAVLNDRENGSLEIYDCRMLKRYDENWNPCYDRLLDACSRMVSHWEDFKDYGRKLEDLKPIYIELSKHIFDPIKDHINVLTHGSYGINNILVKSDYKNGKFLDVIPLDFQNSTWGSPGIDLYYFLNTSLKENKNSNQHIELIQYYYKILTKLLRKLLYSAPIPSLQEFQLQMSEKSFYGDIIGNDLLLASMQRNELGITFE